MGHCDGIAIIILINKTWCFIAPFLYIKILVSEQGNTICEKTVEFSQIVDYEERQKGLS